MDQGAGGEEETYRFFANNTGMLFASVSGTAFGDETGYTTEIVAPSIGTNGADLSITLTTKTNIVTKSSQFGVVARIANRSAARTAGDIQLVVYAPEGGEFENPPASCSGSDQALRCTFDALDSGSETSLSLQVKASELELGRWFASVHEIASEGMGDDPLLENNVVELRTYASLDEDADGMPDYWEYRNNLTVGANDRGEDPDKDGITNIDEYRD